MYGAENETGHVVKTDTEHDNSAVFPAIFEWQPPNPAV